MELSGQEREALAAALATLLPGDGDWPGAASLALANDAWELAELVDFHRPALLDAVRQLGGGFAIVDADSREERLRALESRAPAVFAVLRLVAYDAYYRHPAVRSVLERRCGYPARPPQPLGHELDPFDERLLERQRGRAPFWRPA